MTNRFLGLRCRSGSRAARQSVSLTESQREDVPGRIDIAVEDKPTRGAFVGADSQSLSDFGSTSRADLRRSARVHRYNQPTGAFSLVPENGGEAGPTRIADASSEPATDHAGNVQVFYCNDIVAPNQVQRGLVMEVSANSLDSPVLTSEDLAPLASIVPALFLPGDGTLESSPFRIFGNHWPRVGDELAITRGDERAEPQVKPDSVPGFRQNIVSNAIAGKGYPPIATRIALESDRANPALDWTREEQLGGADALKGESPTVEFPPGARSEGEGIVATTALEARVSGNVAGVAAAVEGSESEINALEDVEQHLGADLTELRPEFFQSRHFSRLCEVVDGDTAFPMISPMLNGRVVKLRAERQLPLSLANGRGRKTGLVLKRASHWASSNLITIHA